MKIEEAQEYVYEITDELMPGYNKKLVNLVMWAYDQGWSESREELREEQHSTEQQEWERSR